MQKNFTLVFIVVLFLISSCKEKPEIEPESQLIQLIEVLAGNTSLATDLTTENIAVDEKLILNFSHSLDTNTVAGKIILVDDSENAKELFITFSNSASSVIVTPANTLSYTTVYILKLEQIQGNKNEVFPGATIMFKTENDQFKIVSITINDVDLSQSAAITEVDLNVTINASFNKPVNETSLQGSIYLLKNGVNQSLNYSLSENNTVLTVQSETQLDYYTSYNFVLSTDVLSGDQIALDRFSKSFFTKLDSTYKFPEISDDELLTLIQSQTFKYFWDFAHPASGMARERNTSGDVVTSGGSGFGLMALIVGIERGFISQAEGIQQFEKIISFLETADRFHGAWPHWLNGSSGAVYPFSTKDNGGDLVETAFLVQGLLTVRQYLQSAIPDEQDLIARINELWTGVEWEWYTQGQNALYWHWSTTYNFEMNMTVTGYNETLIVHVLAASDTSDDINADVYHVGYARNGGISNGNSYYDIYLPLGGAYGGPLFFTHYSHLGLDPRNLSDRYASYWEQNVNHTLINRTYCIDNPRNYIAYSADCWGLTASDNHLGYSAHSPTNDLGVITPTAAISSIPYTPEESMAAIRHFYYLLGDRLWGSYGFYDAFNVTQNWWADSYIAIDQGPIIIMIENHRTGLLWNLFMSAPEIQAGLDKLSFTY